MNIVSIIDAPKTGDSDGLIVTFTQSELEPVTKRLHYSNAQHMIGQPPQWAYQLLMKMREAERDYAYQIFGKDEYRKHVGKMWGDAQPHELKMAEQAAQLRPDLFPGAREPA